MRWMLPAWLAMASAAGQVINQLPLIQVFNAASGVSNSFAPGSLIRILLTSHDTAGAKLILRPSGSAHVLDQSQSGSILARLSPDTALGRATLTVSFPDRSSYTAHIHIVPSQFGIFRDAPIALLTHPAQPGSYVTLRGTGLGTATVDQISVLFGGHAYAPSYAGPVPGLPGTDQINFQIPHDPAVPFGCYVALAVLAGGVQSNPATVSTSADGAPCTHPFGLTNDQEATLDAGGTVMLGTLSFYDLVGRSPFGGTGFTRGQSATAILWQANASTSAALAAPLRAFDATSGCENTSGLIGFLAVESFPPNSLGKLILTKPDKTTVEIPETPAPGFFNLQIPYAPIVSSPDLVNPSFFTPGTWDLSNGFFHAPFEMPPALRITSAPTDPTVTWNGFDFSDNYQAEISRGAFVCTAPANTGRITMAADPATSVEVLIRRRGDRESVIPFVAPDGQSIPMAIRPTRAETLPIQ